LYALVDINIFRQMIPMLFAAFIASEVIIEFSTNSDELLLLTLDAEKAFEFLLQ
jgi:hypothetical protein